MRRFFGQSSCSCGCCDKGRTQPTLYAPNVIKRLALCNFRSFNETVVNLSGFNVLIGANAAGKSNFVDALRFLRDIERHGLSNAVSMQGGVQYLRNAAIGQSQPLQISVTMATDFSVGPLFRVNESPRQYVALRGSELKLSFALSFARTAPTYKVTSESVVADVDVIRYRYGEHEFQPEDQTAGRLTIERNRNRPVYSLQSRDSSGDAVVYETLDPEYAPFRGVNNQELIWREILRFILNMSSVGDTAIFDFDPKLPKRAVQITGLQELEEDGSNLALVLQKILRNREQRRVLTNLLHDLLPFVDRFSVRASRIDPYISNFTTHTTSPALAYPLHSCPTVRSTLLRSSAPHTSMTVPASSSRSPSATCTQPSYQELSSF